MAQSKATSVAAYLDELPAERREAIGRVRDLVKRNLPPGFSEAMAYGMIAWEVPLERYPRTYNGKPLVRAALAAQKNYNALYLSCTYQDPQAEALLREAARREGRKLDMGKSCVRFRAPDELPLDAIGALLRRLSVDDFVASYEHAREGAGQREPAAAKPVPAKRPPAKKAAARVRKGAAK
jgi:hypothetical protein